MKTGIKATRLAMAGFLLPFVMVYAPEILMIGDPLNIFIVSITALIGVYALAIGSIGYFFTKCNAFERILCFVCGIMMVIPHMALSAAGVVILLVVVVINRGRARKTAA